VFFQLRMTAVATAEKDGNDWLSSCRLTVVSTENEMFGSGIAAQQQNSVNVRERKR
jgi:hypothetical protein